MIKFYDILLTILRPFIVLFGKIGLPKRHFTGEDYYKIRDLIQVGDILLAKTNFEFSNIINPAKIKHGAIYVGRVLGGEVCYVFESVGEGAVLTDLVTFLLSKDTVVCTRFRHRDSRLTETLPKTTLRFKGVKYDYLFSDTGKAFYCFELVAACLIDVYPNLSLKVKAFAGRKKIYDHNTFLNDKHFEIIFDTRKV